jgi:predicted Zn-dependent protease
VRSRIAAGACALVLTAAAVLPAFAQDEGVKVGRPSIVRKLIPAERLERAAQLQYGTLKQQAEARRLLVPDGHPLAQRVRRIAQELLPHADKWNERAKEWRWEIMLINSPTINAFCMPGGKIAVFTGLIDRLELTDDELALVLGHEIAHALREHARERAAKRALTNFGALALSLIVGGAAGELARAGGGLMTLKFSRDDEREADLIGMELAARAGYNPTAGLTLWAKMTRAATGAPPMWLSTHPSGEDRTRRIKAQLKNVMPLYERARANRAGAPQ